MKNKITVFSETRSPTRISYALHPGAMGCKNWRDRRGENGSLCERTRGTAEQHPIRAAALRMFAAPASSDVEFLMKNFQGNLFHVHICIHT